MPTPAATPTKSGALIETKAAWQHDPAEIFGGIFCPLAQQQAADFLPRKYIPFRAGGAATSQHSHVSKIHVFAPSVARQEASAPCHHRHRRPRTRGISGHAPEASAATQPEASAAMHMRHQQPCTRGISSHCTRGISSHAPEASAAMRQRHQRPRHQRHQQPCTRGISSHAPEASAAMRQRHQRPRTRRHRRP